MTFCRTDAEAAVPHYGARGLETRIYVRTLRADGMIATIYVLVVRGESETAEHDLADAFASALDATHTGLWALNAEPPEVDDD